MKFPLLALCLALGTVTGLAAPAWQPQPGHTQIPLWPKTPPDSAKNQAPETIDRVTDEPVAGKSWTEVKNVSQPTMTVYSPKTGNTGVAMLVFPGGGYQVLAIDLEGTEVCDWLTARGITCILLKYRVPDSGPHWEDGCKCHITPKAPLALEDAQRALGLVRLRAREWHIDPHKIGVLGFSAGGHLVAAMSTHFEKRAYPLVDAADKESLRPDFAVALYPGHLWMQNQKKFALNPDIHVTATTPPTFLLQAENDNVDNVNQALVYYIALKDARVPTEMHLYAEGGHAFGLRRTKQPITEWPALVEKWLGTIAMIPARN
jgi:acetyl esterase/lipase